MLAYAVIGLNNAEKKLYFPTSYQGKEDLNVMEPLYDYLKQGQKVKFKIKADLEEIIIIDNEWNHLKKTKKDILNLKNILKVKKEMMLVFVKKMILVVTILFYLIK